VTMSRHFCLLIPAVVVLALSGGAAGIATPAPSRREVAQVTHGVIVGDVTARSAVLWARADRVATLRVRLSGGPYRLKAVRVRAGDDYTGHVLITRLKPDRTYRYRVWFSNGQRNGRVVRGSFRTAPSDDNADPVTLAFGGDVAGQNVCRDAAEGFPIMSTIRSARPDVFVGLGDMIYADNACEATWRYARADRAQQHLLASTNYVGVWDDHEVVNDFGPLHDTRDTPPYTPGVHLLPIGLDAFIDYAPIAVAPNTPKRLYRSLRWGKHLELFVLDTRQYRDANGASDSPNRPKTMLGREQLTWLEHSLATSNATWKVIVSSVPMSIPTGSPPANGRDGWANFDQATGFENELLDILRFLERRRIDNTVWITTDVHFAEIFRYTPFAARPDFKVHELVTGPLNAGIFPTRDFDSTLNPERLAFFGPATPEAVTSWAEAKRWFNFGTLAIDRRGSLTMRIVNTAGERAFQLEVMPR
jgi:alkaline phosphatase D